MLRSIWRRLLLVLTVIVAVLGFFAFIELVRAYQVLDQLHPWLGWVYLLVLAVGVVALVVYYVVSVAGKPKVLSAPDRCDHRRYAIYLVELTRRLENNDFVSDELRQSLRYQSVELQRAARKSSDMDEVAGISGRILRDCVEPCYRELGSKADREVQRCVRDVMIGVTISPWRAADLLVVFYRNMRMVVSVMDIYDARPPLRAQISTMVDILKIICTVNILNYGSKLAENLASGIPFVGRFADDIAQGVGAGLLTSMAGHAAIDRCSSLDSWNEADARNKVADKAKVFAADLKGIVVTDILPRMRVRLSKEEADAGPGMMERLKSGVTKAMDDTADVMDAFVRKPAVAAGKGVAATGRGVAKAGKVVGRGVKSGFTGTVSGFRKMWTALRSGMRKLKPTKSSKTKTD